MAAANICLSNLRKMHKWNPLHFRNAIHAIICIGFPVFFPLMLIGGLIGQIAIRGAYGSRLIISGAREYVADAEAARLTKNPAALASALFKVQGRHQMSASQSENDAMMIAGDSADPRATHPDIEERVDALARTTGSMVFNAPDAHQKSKTSRFARKAAGAAETKDRWAPFKKVGAVTGENFFGFTQIGGWTFIAALAFSIFWQGKDILSPSAILEKMDMRPFGEVIGTNELKCWREGRDYTCRDGTKSKVSDYIDQKGTFLGWLAQRNATNKMETDERIDGLIEEHNVRMRTYKGDSGLLEGVELMIGDNGEFLDRDRSTTLLMKVIPKSAILAETKQVGCFHQHLVEGKNTAAEWSMTGETPGAPEFSEYLKEVGQAARMAIGGGDSEILEYAATRRANTRVAFDFYGAEGLERIQGVYDSDTHRRALDRLGKRLQDPTFASDKSELERIELTNLSKRPELYVPCFALRQ